jgi:hypothetical protein
MQDWEIQRASEEAKFAPRERAMSIAWMGMLVISLVARFIA